MLYTRGQNTLIQKMQLTPLKPPDTNTFTEEVNTLRSSQSAFVPHSIQSNQLRAHHKLSALKIFRLIKPTSGFVTPTPHHITSPLAYIRDRSPLPVDLGTTNVSIARPTCLIPPNTPLPWTFAQLYDRTSTGWAGKGYHPSASC